ncbi:unnamed protein product [Moneuplotes crassus]|uniref:Uncharacterized protein n=1 Tax=Euplotes crassus TaxID=5936 RepID=A0AAD1X4E3_EUPCR|nr:unnamed protein product [Moneuplotes crassus]
MGCCSTNSADDNLHRANQKYLQDITQKQKEVNFEEGLPSRRRATRAPPVDFSYESEESESESDDSNNSFLNDSDYYNAKARLKSKFMPFFPTISEVKIFTIYKYSGGQCANNLPFWPQVFHYLSLEDIEIVMLGCKSFYEAAQDERILEKFLDSDDEESDSDDYDEYENFHQPALKKNTSNNYSNKGKSSAWRAASKKLVPKSSDNYFSPYEESSDNKQRRVSLAKRKRSESWTKISIQKKRRNTIIKMHNQSILGRNKDSPAIRLQNVEPIECSENHSISESSEVSEDKLQKQEKNNNKKDGDSFFGITPCESIQKQSSSHSKKAQSKKKRKQSVRFNGTRSPKKSFKFRRDSILKRLKFKPILKFNKDNERENAILNNIKEKMDVYDKEFHNRDDDGHNKLLALHPTKLVEQTMDSSVEIQNGQRGIPQVSQIPHDKVILKLGESSPEVSKHKFNMTKKYSGHENMIGQTLQISEEAVQGLPYPQEFLNNLRAQNEDLRNRVEQNLKSITSKKNEFNYSVGRIQPFETPSEECGNHDTREFYESRKNRGFR